MAKRKGRNGVDDSGGPAEIGGEPADGDSGDGVAEAAAGPVIDVTPTPTEEDKIYHWLLRVVSVHIKKKGGGFALTTKTRGVDPLGEQINLYPLDPETEEENPIENIAKDVLADVSRDASQHGGGHYYLYARVDGNSSPVARYPMLWGPTGPLSPDAAPLQPGTGAGIDALASVMHDAANHRPGNSSANAEADRRALENQQKLWLAAQGGMIEGFLKQQELMSRRQREDDRLRTEHHALLRQYSDRTLDLERAREERREREERNRAVAVKLLAIGGKLLEYQMIRRKAQKEEDP